MGSCVYFVLGVETRLVQTVKFCSSMSGSMGNSQVGGGWMILEIGELSNHQSESPSQQVQHLAYLAAAEAKLQPSFFGDGKLHINLRQSYGWKS